MSDYIHNLIYWENCAREKKLLFCNLYQSFLYNNSPDPTLFAPKDGLHLNYAGTDLLRKKIMNIIRHLSVYW
jgi:lysophospholipase L1-like esterase